MAGKFDLILFDADGTLFDFRASERLAFQDGAPDVCRALAQNHQLGIVTNGFEAVQTARLAASPLAPFVAFMVTSEAAGAAKPDPAVFERALELAARPMARHRVLVVGDGLASDIAGGQRMGFTTCWFNPSAELPPSHPSPDFTISALTQLLDIV